MVTDTLVEEQIEDGRRLLTSLGAAAFEVRVAFWANQHEEERWMLYIASPNVQALGSLRAYRIILERLEMLGSTWFSSSDIKVIDDKAPLAQTVADIQNRFPDAQRLQQPLLRGLPFEDVYIYQLPSTEITIYGMTYGESQDTAMHLSFKPHNATSSLEVQTPGGPIHRFQAKTGFDSLVVAPRGSQLVTDQNGMTVLLWNFRGKWIKSNANEIWSLANLGLHGFRMFNPKSS